MDHDTHAPLHPTPTPLEAHAEALERQRARRASLRDRHSQGLTRLMTERGDLRGVHALADFVDDSVRWGA
ncbi:hypothetical protein KUV85_11695 [Nocardioides panacisoli]|uniref:hypothetical protein n=1 Tax=Nocardioides panacisoli TaxID=627624 RepID=UPI001C62992D|nr:hypothetical protein [Nocardioides panacisoli]QYJ02996.1 hypothetical protein KUV85_11695 [Nocardioides panacisoli]